MILVHDGDRGVAKLSRQRLRARVNHDGEHGADEHQEHGVLPQAVQLFDAESNDIGQVPHGHVPCFLRNTMLNMVRMGMYAARISTKG